MARRARRRVIKATRPDEYALLLEHAPNALYADLFCILRHAGLRVGEAVHLRWTEPPEGTPRYAWVDFEMMLLHVKGKGGWERNVDILPEAERMLRRRENLRSTSALTPQLTAPYVFPRPNGRPLTTRAVQRTIQAIRERVGLPATRLTPHKLRHAFGTDAADRGMPVHVLAEQMGHASVDTTGIYMHSRPGQARRYFDDANDAQGDA